MKCIYLCMFFLIAGSALGKVQLERRHGACDLTETRQHIYAANHEFADHMSICVVKDYFRFTASLDTNCLKSKYKDMSSKCIDCFATMTKCAADNCVSDCKPKWVFGYGEQSEQCKACRLKNCGEAMAACSGVSTDTLPDFKR